MPETCPLMSFAHLFGLLNNIANIWKKVFKTFTPVSHLLLTAVSDEQGK